MKRIIRYISLALVFIITVSCFCGCGAQTAQTEVITQMAPITCDWVVEDEIAELDDVKGVMVYQDGVPLAENAEIDFTKDVKKIYYSDDKQTVYDYAWGYVVDLPLGLTPNYEKARTVCRYESDDLVITICLEDSTGYETTQDYHNNNLMLKMQDKGIQSLNNYTMDNIVYDEIMDDGYVFDLFRGSHSQLAETHLASYSYVFVRENLYSKTNYRFMIKYKIGVRYANVEKMVRDSLTVIPRRGRVTDNTDYEYPAVPNYWNDETKRFYKWFCNSDRCQFGVTSNANYGVLARDKYFEDIVGTQSDLVLYYTGCNDLEFDFELAQKCYEQDKIVCIAPLYDDGTGLMTAQPFNVLQGKWDAQYEELAKQIKEWGHPVIVRMQSEFNASWGRDGAFITMGDPDWFRDAWMHIYNIFVAQGCDNAIFMFNIQSSRMEAGGETAAVGRQVWNEYIHYAPTKEYFQIFGITDYDMGQEWDAGYFAGNYKGTEVHSIQYFSNWPWFIGEYGCSGAETGVDKTAYIKGMFETIDQFPNIKGACWFDSANVGSDGVAAQNFYLHADESAGIAFYQGIKDARAKCKQGIWKYD